MAIYKQSIYCRVKIGKSLAMIIQSIAQSKIITAIFCIME